MAPMTDIEIEKLKKFEMEEIGNINNRIQNTQQAIDKLSNKLRSNSGQISALKNRIITLEKENVTIAQEHIKNVEKKAELECKVELKRKLLDTMSTSVQMKKTKTDLNGNNNKESAHVNIKTISSKEVTELNSSVHIKKRKPEMKNENAPLDATIKDVLKDITLMVDLSEESD